jgi:hypothetical protein
LLFNYYCSWSTSGTFEKGTRYTIIAIIITF